MALNDKKKGDLIFAPSSAPDIDSIGFSLRLQGIQIRDCISCQGSEDGKEEVANWICEPSCPVRALDGQSGNRPGFSGGGKRSPNNVYRSLPSGEASQTYNDEGGASRFFKQVQSDDELDDYLEVLLRSHK